MATKQVIVEFVGNTDGLKAAEQELQAINQLGKEQQAAFEKANQSTQKAFESSTQSADTFLKKVKATTTFIANEFAAGAKEGFDEAMQSIKKTTETTKQFDTSTKSATARLREIKQELAGLDEGSERFRELTAEAGKLQDKVGDVSQRVKILASDTRGLDAFLNVATGITGAFTAAQGAAALLGKENEDLQKALLKVQATLAVLNGLQAVAATLNKDSAASVVLAANAQRLYALATGSSTGALRLFRLALIATGIGALVVLLGTLIANWDELTKAINKAAKELLGIEDFGEAIIKGLTKISTAAQLVFERLGRGFKALWEGQFTELLNIFDGFNKELDERTKKALDERQEKIENKAIVEQIQLQIAANKRRLKILEAYGKDTLELQITIAKQELEVLKRTGAERSAILDKQNEIELLQIKQRAANNAEQIQLQIDANKRRLKILEAYGKDTLELQITIAKQELELLKKTGAERSAILDKQNEIEVLEIKQFAELQKSITKDKIGNEVSVTNNLKSELDKRFKDQIDANEKQIEAERQRAKTIEEIARTEAQVRRELQQTTDAFILQSAGAVFDFLSVGLDKQNKRLEEQKQRELSIAGDNAQKRAEIEEKFAEKQKAIERQKAATSAAGAIAELFIRTFQAVQELKARAAVLNTTPGLGAPLLAQIPFLIASAGIQAALIASQIPKFATGTDSAPGGLAIVGEEGQELMIGRSGKVGLTPGTPTLMDVAKGTKIIPADETAALLSQIAFSRVEQMPPQRAQSIDENVLADRIVNAITKQPQVAINIDKSGFQVFTQSRNKRVQYLNNRYRG